MSDVLRGLYARRADLERRIAAAQNANIASSGLTSANDSNEDVFGLHLQLKSVVTQIDVYASSDDRWAREA